MGVTEVRLENQYFPARMVSVRRLGRDEIDGGGDGIGVGVEAEGVCRARSWSWGCGRSCVKPLGMGSKFFFFVNAVLAAPPPEPRTKGPWQVRGP